MCMCSVLFNFLGRDFFNALSAKDAERFTQMLFKWLGGIALGVPVFVYRDYLQACRLFFLVCQQDHAPDAWCAIHAGEPRSSQKTWLRPPA